MRAQIVILVDDGKVSVATFVRYVGAIAALVWPAVAVVHRRAMPGLLHHAVRAREKRRS